MEPTKRTGHHYRPKWWETKNGKQTVGNEWLETKYGKRTTGNKWWETKDRPRTPLLTNRRQMARPSKESDAAADLARMMGDKRWQTKHGKQRWETSHETQEKSRTQLLTGDKWWDPGKEPDTSTSGRQILGDKCWDLGRLLMGPRKKRATEATTTDWRHIMGVNDRTQEKSRTPQLKQRRTPLKKEFRTPNCLGKNDRGKHWSLNLHGISPGFQQHYASCFICVCVFKSLFPGPVDPACCGNF